MRGGISSAPQAEALSPLTTHQVTPTQWQPVCSGDFPGSRTAPPIASLLPVNFYSFQNFPHRREECCSMFLPVSSSPAPETSFPLCWSFSKGAQHIWVGCGLIKLHLTPQADTCAWKGITDTKGEMWVTLDIWPEGSRPHRHAAG